MAKDRPLVEAAIAARNRLQALEAELDHAKVDYQHAVRKLHHSGASLREIAADLGISHQRVHQLVDTPEARGWNTRRRRDRGGWKGSPKEELACSFCGDRQTAVAKMVAGPGVYICDGCVRAAGQVVLRGETHREGGACLMVEHEDRVRCSFCGKAVPQVVGMVTGAGTDFRICAECLALCNEIIAEELGQQG
jgi:hypothetical protein